MDPLDLLLPKANSGQNPPIGARIGTETEAMTKAGVLVILDFGSGLSQEPQLAVP